MRVHTGVIRVLDPLGRVVIPREILKELNIELGQKVATKVVGNEIIVNADADRGIVRNLDQLGRLVIASEVRKQLGLVSGEGRIEFLQDGEDIIMRKYEAGCTFCGSLEIERVHKDKKVCSYCVGVLRG